MSDVTQILERIESGDPAAVNWPAASNVKLSMRTRVGHGSRFGRRSRRLPVAAHIAAAEDDVRAGGPMREGQELAAGLVGPPESW